MSKTVVVTGCVLAVVLALLATVGYVGFARLRDTTDQVTAATARMEAYQSVERALADEAVAETAYRRTPGEATQAQVVSSLAALDAAAARVREVGRAADGVVADQLLELNHRYAREVVSATGADAAAVTLQTVQQLLDDNVHGASAELHGATQRQRDQITTMAWRAPVALFLAFVVVGLCWVLLALHSRRAAVRAEESEQLALRDPLTGLGNRRAFERALGPELKRPTPDSAVVLVDLDGFKAINDTWGHDVGDEVLKAVAQRLQATARASDFVTRIGGDEFALLARPALHVDALVERLQEAICQPLQLDRVTLHPSASMGWADVARGASQEEVLRAADRGLYDRKRAHIGAGRRLGDDRRSG